MKGLLLGVDGGGSKTVALLADRKGKILARGWGGPSNIHAAGVEPALRELELAVDGALAAAGVKPASLRALCLGMSGAGRTEDQDVFRAWAGRRFPGLPLRIATDAELVLAAGTPAGWGLAVVSGTGSIVWARSRDGLTARAGGWGSLMGDEGSGYAIGQAALQMVARAADGRAAHTALTRLVLARWGLADAQALIRRVSDPPLERAEVAALTPLVEQAAAQGDLAAERILAQAGFELAAAARAAADQLSLSGAIPCALSGGALLHSGLLPSAFLVSARMAGLTLEPLERVEEPVLGAVRLAREI